MSVVSRRTFLEHVAGAGALLLGAAACSSADAEPSDPRAGSSSGSPGATPPPGAAAADGGAANDASAGPRAPTPTCDDPTDDDPEGPYYTPGAPKRSSLVASGMVGTRLVLSGRVLAAGAACSPLAGAEIDVWQANDAGDYDNVGFTLRGVVVADASGGYRLETIVPGRYLNGGSYRPRHIHVIVRAPGRASLTTQLYFAGDPFNAADGMFKPSLLLTPTDAGAGVQSATFDFVLA